MLPIAIALILLGGVTIVWLTHVQRHQEAADEVVLAPRPAAAAPMAGPSIHEERPRHPTVKLDAAPLEYTWRDEVAAKKRYLWHERAQQYEKKGRLADAASYWSALEQHTRAARLMVRAGKHAEAAELFALDHEWTDAIEAHIAAGQLREAIKVCVEICDHMTANRLKGQLYAENNKHEKSARAYARAEEYALSGAQFELAGNTKQALKMYGKAGDAGATAKLHAANQDWAKAAESYETAEDFAEAGRCWERAGEILRVPHCLVQIGRPFQAGMVAMKHGAIDQAIAHLEAVPPLTDHFIEANRILVTLYESRGRRWDAGRALGVYLEQCLPSPENVLLFFKLIRFQKKTSQLDAALDTVALLTNHGFGTPELDALAGKINDSKAEKKRPIQVAKRTETGPDLSIGLGLSVQVHGRRQKPVGAAVSGPGRRRQPFQRYRFGDEIGQGGWGQIYRAYDRALDEDVAVKFLKPGMLADDETRRMFLDEAKVISSLNHPGIVRIFDIEIDAKPIHFSMELIDGHNLVEVITQSGGRLRHPEVLKIAEQLCAALDYAHARHIVHRDIKPGNVMMTTKGRVKLLDFGLARMLTRSSETEEIAGTWHYMSPEQIEGETIDHRTDVYSAGCLLYACYAGEPPFTDGDVLHQHLLEAPPDVEFAVPGIPNGVGAVLQKALSKGRTDRFQTAGALYKALAGCRGRALSDCPTGVFDESDLLA